MKKKLTILFAFTVILSAPAVAQQEKGDFQLQAQGSYYSFSGFDGGFLFVNASKFFTQNIEAGISPQISFSTETTVNLSFYGNYNFVTADAKMVPYIGAQILVYGLGSSFGSQTGFGFKGGLRYFITEKVNIDVGPNVTFLEGATLFYFNAGLGFIISRRK